MTKKELGVILSGKRTLSKTKLSEVSGLSRTQINNIEQGRSNYTVDSLLVYIDNCDLNFMITTKVKK